MSRLRAGLLMLLLVAAAAHGQDYDALIKRALQQRDAGNMAAAEQTLRQAQPLAADKAEVNYLLGMVLAFQQKYGESLALLDGELKLHPDNIDLRLGRARVLSFEGAYQDAMTTVEQVLRRQPDNLEALALAGRIAHYQKRPVAAQLYYSQVLEHDLDNLDALIGMYDSFLQEGKPDKAAPYLGMAAELAPNHIDVLTRQHPEQYSSQPHHQISVGYGQSSLDQPGLSDWHDRSFEYRHLSSDGNQQYVRVERNNRFDKNDTMIEAGLALNQHGKLPWEIAVGYTQSPDFMPRYFGRLGASTPLTNGSTDFGTVILTGLYQYSSYVNGKTERVQTGLEWYIPNTDLWLTPNIGMVRDQSGIETFAWNLGLHWQATGSARFGVTYTDSPETENLITRDSTSTSVYWRQDLGAAWLFYLTWTRIDLDTLYVRKAIDLNLQHQF
ncbi:MAG TPA: YaiO family outer membrane beta-barrel protein [Candidatus Acidoferrum sp.]|nr:YaiO family outer membrane beta-barrel protein [Candidatus Acidoferrum sp.]